MILNFPTLSIDQDSQYFRERSAENPAVAKKMEGGYVHTRPRHTRRPRRSFSTGFSFLNEADKAALQAFWNAVHGSSDAFYWTHPISKEQIYCRFAESEEFEFRYAGVGDNFRWDIELKLVEV